MGKPVRFTAGGSEGLTTNVTGVGLDQTNPEVVRVTTAGNQVYIGEVRALPARTVARRAKLMLAFGFALFLLGTIAEIALVTAYSNYQHEWISRSIQADETSGYVTSAKEYLNSHPYDAQLADTAESFRQVYQVLWVVPLMGLILMAMGAKLRRQRLE